MAEREEESGLGTGGLAALGTGGGLVDISTSDALSEVLTAIQSGWESLQAAQERELGERSLYEGQGTLGAMAEDLGRLAVANTLGLVIPPLGERAMKGVTPFGLMAAIPLSFWPNPKAPKGPGMGPGVISDIYRGIHRPKGKSLRLDPLEGGTFRPLHSGTRASALDRITNIGARQGAIPTMSEHSMAVRGTLGTFANPLDDPGTSWVQDNDLRQALQQLGVDAIIYRNNVEAPGHLSLEALAPMSQVGPEAATIPPDYSWLLQEQARPSQSLWEYRGQPSFPEVEHTFRTPKPPADVGAQISDLDRYLSDVLRAENRTPVQPLLPGMPATQSTVLGDRSALLQPSQAAEQLGLPRRPEGAYYSWDAVWEGVKQKVSGRGPTPSAGEQAATAYLEGKGKAAPTPAMSQIPGWWASAGKKIPPDQKNVAISDLPLDQQSFVEPSSWGAWLGTFKNADVNSELAADEVGLLVGRLKNGIFNQVELQNLYSYAPDEQSAVKAFLLDIPRADSHPGSWFIDHFGPFDHELRRAMNSTMDTTNNMLAKHGTGWLPQYQARSLIQAHAQVFDLPLRKLDPYGPQWKQEAKKYPIFGYLLEALEDPLTK